MRSPCDPPDFDQRDWSQFDFSRWDVTGVAPDATSAAIAELAQRLFTSPEWRERFQATLPALRGRVLSFHREHLRQLEEEKEAAARDFDQRLIAARQRSEEFGKTLQEVAAPPLVQPVPHTFQVAVKVMAEKGRVGLPGVIVRMTEPGHPEAVLGESVTDVDGNAILGIPREQAAERDKTDAALVFLDPAGKPLHKRSEVVCIRVGQVETKVISVRDTAELEPQKAAALALRSQREARARSLAAKVELLRQEQEVRLRDLDCRREETQKIIEALEKASAPPPGPSEPAPAPSAAPTGERPKAARPPAPRKRRKKP